ncbi:MAG: hypothetical protein AYK19_08610 [Theionarchaea archaeon DG-70-1]|nr:MAG: hypothetical protein AYK19_08610 [Theionarchaea archaeon DG-70-1]
MRDKVLCKGKAVPKAAAEKEVFFLFEKGYLRGLISSLAFFVLDSVPVSVREGEKMSLNEVLGFFDLNAAWRDQRAKGFLETSSKRELDTILATESLFKGTVVDFDLGSHSGGGSYANNSFAVN